MRDLPAGTVTFLFTDVEGSTRLLHEFGAAYADLLADHRRVLREAFVRHGGVEVDTQGDAFFVAFARASEALAAAREGQEALGEGPVRVRMGVHTGEPIVTDEGYVGLDVHRAARIAAVGHGGQVLVSRSTRDLAGELDLRDLGEHRLKDLDAPVCLFQLGVETFPPPRTISSTNLPRPGSSFVGRQREVAEVASLVREGGRLVTLTGSGGTGKTRIAIEAAADLVPEFRAGVFWVGLASLREPGLVSETISQTLGAKGSLAAHIADRELLLLLDNLEQVVDCAPELSALLEACPRLSLLVTSRELLRIRGEVEYLVLPLGEHESIELFCARARAEPGEDVARLCRALDNLPLALELAAARSRALSPAQILDRLSRRLDLFRGGRDADPRQQTLRATIEWSYELLAPEEQRVFAGLSAFSGGCTLEGAEEVVEADLDTVQALVEKSLLRCTDERFWMLETIRDFAVERLAGGGAAVEVRRRHAEYFLRLAERVEPALARQHQAEWLDVLERDHANLRAGLGWFLESAAPDPALRLAVALRSFWMRRGYLSEGRRWLADTLAAGADASQARVKALFGASLLAALQGDWPAAKGWATDCRRLSLELGETELAAQSLLTLGRATLAEGEYEHACSFFEEAATIGSGTDVTEVAAMARFNLGYAALSVGDLVRARPELEAGREGFDEHGDAYGVARALAALGSVALHEGHTDEAVARLRESLTLSRSLGDRDNMAWALQLLGVAVSASQSESAARLLGAAESLREALGVALEGLELTLHERALSALQSALDEEALAAAWAAGRDASPDQAVEEALRHA